MRKFKVYSTAEWSSLAACCAHIHQTSVCRHALFRINWLHTLFTFSGCGIHYTMCMYGSVFCTRTRKHLTKDKKTTGPLHFYVWNRTKLYEKLFMWLRVTRMHKERKKKKEEEEKKRFLVPSGTICKLPRMDRLSKCKITRWWRLEHLKWLRFWTRFCNVLRLWSVRAIPTYRVYWLYDIGNKSTIALLHAT